MPKNPFVVFGVVLLAGGIATAAATGARDAAGLLGIVGLGLIVYGLRRRS